MQCLKIFGLLLLLLTSQAKAQHVAIRLKVTSSDGVALSGAHIDFDDSREGYYTNQEGLVFFQVEKNKMFFVKITYLGFEPLQQNYSISNDTSIVVLLRPEAKLLRQIVIEEKQTNVIVKENTLPIAIVKQDHINFQSSAGIASAVKSVPGADISMIGSSSSKPFIRGLGQNRIAVFEQNIRQEGQQWGLDHGLEIDPNIARSVEVIKGPNSLVYGSDAIGGVIIINPPVNVFGKKMELHSTSGFESNNRLFSQSAEAIISDSFHVFRVIASVSRYGDYRVPADSFEYIGYRYPLQEGILKNTAGEKQSFHLSAAWKHHSGIWNLTYSVYHEKNGFFSGAHGIPGYGALTPDSNHYNIDLPYQQVTHQKIIINYYITKGKHLLKTDFAFQNNLRAEYSTPHSHGLINLPQTDKELGLNLNTFSFYAKDIYHENEKTIIVSGFALENISNAFSGYYSLMPRYKNLRSGLFTFYNRELGQKLKFSTGLRTDWSNIHIYRYYDENVSVSDYRLRSPEIRQNHVSLTYSAGLNFSPGKHTTYKINLGKSFRMPLANELSINGIHHGSLRHEMGDSSLRPEVCYQLDLDALFDQEKKYGEFSFFASYFPSLIYLDPTGEFSFLPDAGQIYRYSQAKAFRAGGEFLAGWSPTRFFSIETKADYVFAWNINNGLPMPMTTAPKAGISLNWKWGGKVNPYSLEWESIYHFRQNQVARNELSTPASFVSSLMFKKTLKKTKFTYDILAGIYNLFNTRYYNHLSYYRILNLPEPGRNFQIKFIINFSKKQDL